MTGNKRLIIAALIAFLTLILLGPMAPTLDSDLGNYNAYAFWLKFDGAVRYFFAVAVAAVIARRSIVIPAMVFAFAGWAWVVSVLDQVAAPAESVSLVQLAVQNADGLLMVLIGAFAGARIGRWFYQHEITQAHGSTS